MMSTFKRITKYCVLALMAAALYYYALTTEGYGKIYELLVKMNSIDITEITTLLEDEEAEELLGTAKMILVAKTGHAAGDLIIAENIADITDRIKQADMWVEQIPNSEAEMLNRYMKAGEEEYLDETHFESLDRQDLNYKHIAERLFESGIIRNKYYKYAGISKEKSVEQQVKNVKMLIEKAQNNQIHTEIQHVIGNTHSSDEVFLEKLALSLAENPSMYKEHFLTEFTNLTAAMQAYEASKNPSYSEADAFCELYRENPTSTFVTFMKGDNIAEFMEGVENQTAIFNKRRMIIEAFDYTENNSDAIKVRIVDSAKMKYADAYGSFVYNLSGKEFMPTPRETERYYIRIEDIES